MFVPGRAYKCKFTKEIIFVITAKRFDDSDPMCLSTITIMITSGSENQWRLFADQLAALQNWEEITRW